MQLLPSLLFGISASLDALLVGTSYGLRGVRIRLWQNLFISLITLLGTCLSVSLGHYLTSLLPEVIADRAGSMILMLLGIYYIAKWILVFLQNRLSGASTKRREMASASVRSLNSWLTVPEVLILSMTLSLNNLSVGLSASLAGLTLLPTAVATFVCSVLFLFAGNRLGGMPLLQFAGRAADPLSGLLLIGLGLLQLFL